MKSMIILLGAAVLGTATSVWANITGIEPLTGTFAISGGVSIDWEYLGPGESPWPPDYSDSFVISQSSPVSNSLLAYGIGVSCEASYERVAVYNYFQPDPPYYMDPPFFSCTGGKATSDYLFMVAGSSLYEFIYEGDVTPGVIGPPEWGTGDRIVISLTDLTTSNALLDIDMSFSHFVCSYGDLYSLGYSLSQTFYLDNSHIYELVMLVQPDCAWPGECWRGDMMLSVRPIPAPGAMLLGVTGAALAGWLRRRRTL